MQINQVKYKLIKNAKKTGINEQANNYILSPYNLFSRGLRLSTKWIYRRVLINKEKNRYKTRIKVTLWKPKLKKGSNFPPGLFS